MSVRTLHVKADEAELRLDRWFRRHFPDLSHGRLEKLLRTGQIRVDGGRAKSSLRLEAGQAIRVPPLGEAQAESRPKTRVVSEADERFVQELVLHRDDHVIALDKPAGLAVQGGTGTTRHLDALLDGLIFDAEERPRLAHRLDRDTSGVLVLGRTARATAFLAKAFQGHEAHKTYWAITVGVPRPGQGRVDLALLKKGGNGSEKMREDEEGLRAVTDYRVLDRAGSKAAWVELTPLTGRTHQLRAHCAAIGAPILGDGKYGGAAAQRLNLANARKLHLHARALEMPHPAGRMLRVTAPLPGFMRETYRFLGFEPRD